MATEKIDIRFYHVTECGYYRRGGTDSEFCDLSAMLGQLRAWRATPNMRRGDTCTFPIDLNNPDPLPVYLLDIQVGQHGDVILTLWNAMSATAGTVPTMDETALATSAATAHVANTAIGDHLVPGYPSYFWFLPELGHFATVRCAGSMNGHPELQRYLKGFLEWRNSAHVDITQVEVGEIEIGGYWRSPGSAYEEVSPRFKSQAKHLAGALAKIRADRAKIHKVVHHGTMKRASRPQEAASMFGWLRNLSGMSSDAVVPAAWAFKYEFENTPNASELNDIIDYATSEECKDDDIGFRMRGNANQIVWIKSVLASTSIDLDVRNSPAEPVLNAEHLLIALQPERQRLINTYIHGQTATQVRHQGRRGLTL